MLAETVEQVRCRWCDAVDAVELVPRPAGVAGSRPQPCDRRRRRRREPVRLPGRVRQRVVALAADALGRLPADQVPAPLRAVARFAPGTPGQGRRERSRHRPGVGPAFRQRVAARPRGAPDSPPLSTRARRPPPPTRWTSRPWPTCSDPRVGGDRGRRQPGPGRGTTGPPVGRLAAARARLAPGGARPRARDCRASRGCGPDGGRPVEGRAGRGSTALARARGRARHGRARPPTPCDTRLVSPARRPPPRRPRPTTEVEDGSGPGSPSSRRRSRAPGGQPGTARQRRRASPPAARHPRRRGPRAAPGARAARPAGSTHARRPTGRRPGRSRRPERGRRCGRRRCAGRAADDDPALLDQLLALPAGPPGRRRLQRHQDRLRRPAAGRAAARRLVAGWPRWPRGRGPR